MNKSPTGKSLPAKPNLNESNEIIMLNIILKEEELKNIYCDEHRKIFYKWDGTSFLQLKSNAEIQRIVENTLQLRFKSEYTNAKVIATINNVIRNLPIVPERSQRDIIPLQNCWIEIVDGKSKVITPCPAVGVFHKVNISRNKSAHIKYKESGLFHNFISKILPDQSTRNVVQEYCGYTLIYSKPLQNFMVWTGSGANGKSQLLELLVKLHAKVANFEFTNSKYTFDKEHLIDASLIYSPDEDKGYFNDSFMKMATDNIAINIPIKNKAPIQTVLGKFLVVCNSIPKTKDYSKGMYRRLIPIEFPVEIPENERIKNLGKKIFDGDGWNFLCWCLEGLERLLTNKDFTSSSSIDKFKENYFDDRPLPSFLTEYGITVTDKDVFCYKDEIYYQYREFMDKNGYAITNSQNFWTEIRGLLKSKCNVEIKETKRNNKRVLNIIPTSAYHKIFAVLDCSASKANEESPF